MDIDHDITEEQTLCYQCPGGYPDGVVRNLTGKTKVVQARFDPTQVYELTCGHWAL